MAAVITVGRLRQLVEAASREGSDFAWIEDDTLLIGPQLDQIRFRVDFALETLIHFQLDTANGEPVSPSGRQASGGDLGDGWTAPTLVEAGGSRGRRTGNFALVLEGRIFPARSQRELLRIAFQAIERERPGTLDKLSREKGRTKRPVARQRELLYEDAKLAKYAEQVEGGWWIATNNSYPEVEKFIRRAGHHAGLHVELRRSP